MDTDFRKLLLRWQKNCLRSQLANYDAANIFSKRNYWLGVPTIIFTAIVGTSVFATMQQDNVSKVFQFVLGFVSIAAAVFAALQTFFNWGDLISKYRNSAAEYGAIKREIDQLLAQKSEIQDEAMSSIREKMDTISRESPEVPRNIWEKARKQIPTESNTQ